MNFYGQHGEDSIAHSILNFGSGIFLDVGAHDGWRFSNTLVFEEMGWQGICIEPHPLYYEILRLRRHCISLNCLVGDQNKLNVDFWVSNYGELSSVDGQRSRRGYDEKYFVGWHHVQSPMLTLDTILAIQGCHNVDYVSVDVEGFEMSVLKGFSLSKYNPKLVIVEENSNGTDIESYFSSFGYRLGKRHHQNAFYCRDASDADIIRDLSPSSVTEIPHILEKASSS